MRTATSLLATLALAACGASTELALETEGIARGAADVPESTGPGPAVGFDVAIVTSTGVPRLDDPHSPGASIDPEHRREDRGDAGDPPAPGDDDPGAMDRIFDAGGTCAPAETARLCPDPDTDLELSERQHEQLGALAAACGAWLERGPSSYAMDIIELRVGPEIGDAETAIDATVCAGDTVAATDVDSGDLLDAETVASIDDLFFAAAEHVRLGDAIEVRVDPNLSYITRMTVTTGAEPEPEIFEVTTTIRPIGPSPID